MDTTVGIAQVATHLAGGAGPNSNTVFKTHFTPIVDGTNGGVVTTNPANVSVLVAGLAAVVTAVDGQHGLVTLATGVLPTQTLTITYYTNQYQYTNDILPAPEVASIIQVGLGPNRSDFIQGTDFTLNQDGTQIAWGANADTAAGVTNPLSSAVFGPTQITTTLIDEQVWLRPVTGAVNGINQNFTLADVPVDGSGLNRPTDNPALIAVYVGVNPIAALLAGPVVVAQLNGDAAAIELYNPPVSGNVYASYWRSQLNDHTFTLTVQQPGIPGQGTYSITNELGQVVPSTVVGPAAVADSNFASTGIVWPNNFPDLDAEPNDATETVTLTFQDDDLLNIITPGTQASVRLPAAGGNFITFRAFNPGIGPNGVTSIQWVNNAAEGIAAVGSNGSSPVYSGGTATPGPTLGYFFTGATPLAFSAAAAQWQASHVYSVGDAIYDVVANTIQVVTTGGTSGAVKPGTTFALSSADNAIGANTTYHGTSGFLGASNPDGLTVTITGFTTGANNVTGLVVSHTLTDLVVVNAGGVSESHVAVATVETAFSATPGVTTADGTGTLVWTSNGVISTLPENIYANIITEAVAATRTLAQLAALFSGANVVNTPLAGTILATVTGVPEMRRLHRSGPMIFAGGTGQVVRYYANRFLVTSSRTSAQQLADKKGITGGATTPAYANFDGGDDVWLADTQYSLNQTIIDTSVSSTIQGVSVRGHLCSHHPDIQQLGWNEQRWHSHMAGYGTEERASWHIRIPWTDL